MQAKGQLLLAAIAVITLLGSTAQAEKPSPRLKPGRVEVSVKDLHCATCAKKVARKLYAIKGVRKVSASVENDLVVAYLPVDHPVPVVAIWSAFAAADLEPVELRHDDQRYDANRIKPLIAARTAAKVR